MEEAIGIRHGGAMKPAPAMDCSIPITVIARTPVWAQEAEALADIGADLARREGGSP